MIHFAPFLCVTLGLLSTSGSASDKEPLVADSPVQLRKKLKEQEELLKHYRSIATGVGESGNALAAPFGRFLLVRNQEQLLAIQVVQHVPNWREWSKSKTKIRWFLQDQKSKKWRSGATELSEWRNGRSTGSDFIVAGNSRVEWSSGDWIYFSKEHPFQMARTEWIAQEQINANAPDLVWFSMPPEKVRSPHRNLGRTRN